MPSLLVLMQTRVNYQGSSQWYMQAKAVKKKENIGGGFDIGNINAGSELYYPNICGMKK